MQRVIGFLRVPVDVLFALLAVPSGLLLRLYRAIGSATLPVTTSLLRRIGVFPIRRHYYEPLFDDRVLTKSLRTPRDLPGIDWRHEEQLALLRELRFADEFREFVESEAAAGSGFSLDNPNFKSGDADFLFQYVRYLKPGKVIEIGSGASTQVVRRALQLNRDLDSVSARHVCVEPYQNPWLEKVTGIELLRERVENSTLDWSADLDAGDLLFIDSSHMIRPQGDVLFEYLEILPRLKQGVAVHIHDIFSPRDYLDEWVRDEVRFWNEQYLLEAMLGNTSRYRVIAALNYLHHACFDDLQRVCPYLTRDREPGSFYLQVQ